MLTVVESPIFQKLWPRYWDEAERADFASFIALNPEAGSVIRGSGGVRKVRWVREGTGKSESGNISLITLKEIRRALEI